MIGKRAKMGAWGDPPNFVAPVSAAGAAAAAAAGGARGGAGGGALAGGA